MYRRGGWHTGFCTVLFSSGLTLQDLFVDLNKSCDYKYNEYVLKYFFLSADPLLREDVTAQYLFIYIFLVVFHRSMFQYF